ncbi:MAG: thiamine phosphate synthase [Hyphomicrobiaceae bacterium]|nr:MAG: thiamine phosphate synthase [Hyphomicrobiaceae bacterium]
MLDQSNVSCVLFPAALEARIRPLIAAAQRRSVAALVRGDIKLAARLEADGVHLPADLESYEYARDLLGLSAVIGIDSGTLRDDAMTLAEAGAEYIAFAREDRRALLDKVEWWSEVFTVPCAVFGVATAEDALAFASAGADFVAPAPSLLAGGEMADTLRKFAGSLASAPAHDGGSA